MRVDFGLCPDHDTPLEVHYTDSWCARSAQAVAGLWHPLSVWRLVLQTLLLKNTPNQIQPEAV